MGASGCLYDCVSKMANPRGGKYWRMEGENGNDHANGNESIIHIAVLGTVMKTNWPHISVARLCNATSTQRSR